MCIDKCVKSDLWLLNYRRLKKEMVIIDLCNSPYYRKCLEKLKCLVYKEVLKILPLNNVQYVYHQEGKWLQNNMYSIKPIYVDVYMYIETSLNKYAPTINMYICEAQRIDRDTNFRRGIRS